MKKIRPANKKITYANGVEEIWVIR